jgi:hypothetical protein
MILVRNNRNIFDFKIDRLAINSYLCIKGIIRRMGMFKARGTRAFKFPRAIIDNYARGTYNVLFYFIISKRFKQIFIFLKGNQLKVVSMQI